MPDIASYFNPFSSQHNALKTFSSMSTPKQILTIIATCLTLPLGIIGGVATFRALTNRFCVIGPTYRSPQVSEVARQGERILNPINSKSTPEVSSPPDPNLEKMLTQFRDKSLTQSEALRLINVNDLDLNTVGKDGQNLLHIICGRRDFDAVVYAALINPKADFSIRDKTGHTPEFINLRANASRTNKNKVNNDLFLLKNADTNVLRRALESTVDIHLIKAILIKLENMNEPLVLNQLPETISANLALVLLEKAQTPEAIKQIFDRVDFTIRAKLLNDDFGSSEINVAAYLLQALKENNQLDTESKNAIVGKIVEHQFIKGKTSSIPSNQNVPRSKPTAVQSGARRTPPALFSVQNASVQDLRTELGRAEDVGLIRQIVQQLELKGAPLDSNEIPIGMLSPNLALVFLERANTDSEINTISNQAKATVDALNLGNEFDSSENDGFGLPSVSARKIDPKEYLLNALNNSNFNDSEKAALRVKLERIVPEAKPAQVTSPPKSTPKRSVTGTTKNRPVRMASPMPSNLSMAEVKSKLETTYNIPELKRYLRLLDAPFTLAQLPNGLLSPQLAMILLEEGSCPQSTIYAIIDQVLRTMEAEDISRSFPMDENDGYGEPAPVMQELDPKKLLREALNKEASYSDAQKAIIRANISRYNF